ncbi:MAG TPA: cache domain-containing protein, partial [Microvirga sp.]|nr:cache domain-containing protein [Microvirga sp.]
MSPDSVIKRSKWTAAFTGVSGRFYAGMAFGVLALIALAIYGSLTISSILLDGKRSELKHLTEAAVSIVADLEARARRGEMTEEQAKKVASDTLRVLRYGGSEYFFIQDYKYVMVMHPFNKALEGKDNSAVKDANGLALFKEIVDVGRSGGGFINYLFNKPNQTVPQPKLSYAMNFDKWGWVIGTGVYIDDLAAVAASYRNLYLMLVVGAGIVLIAVAFALGRSISRPIQKLVVSMRSVAEGDLSVVVEGTGRRDEIGVMAGAVQVFKEQGLEARRLAAEQAAETQAKMRRAQMLDELTRGFESKV